MLADRLDHLFDNVEVLETGPAALGACAGTLFDRYHEDPELARLLAWESLELPATPVSPARLRACAAQSDAIRAVLPGTSSRQAEQLLLSIITLVTGWWTLGSVGAAVLGAAFTDQDARRAAVVAHATRLAAHD